LHAVATTRVAGAKLARVGAGGKASRPYRAFKAIARISAFTFKVG